MKKIIQKFVFASGMLLALNASGQSVIVDDLDWISDNVQTSQTSPNFSLCLGEVNYTISTPNQGNFTHVGQTSNNSLTTGAFFPADVYDAVGAIQINIDFSAPVENLKVRIHDLDGTTGPETITAISPNYSSLTSVVGTIFDPNAGTFGQFTQINATADNSTGWINWDGPVTSVSITYNRPSSGYGLVIDGIEFDCERPEGCYCNSQVRHVFPGTTQQNGTHNAAIGVYTYGEEVSSLTLDLSSYVSNVNDWCLLCDVVNQESFGTITTAPIIAGVAGVLYDPSGIGAARKVVYNFSTPTAISGWFQFTFQFPPVSESCTNSVNYCLDITLKKPDCTSCEYELCNARIDKPEEQIPTYNGILYDTPNMNKTNNGESLEISPNPASDFITVNVLDEELMGRDMTITNSVGGKVKTVNLKNRSNKVNVSNLPSGVYFISVNSSDNEMSFKLIID